MEEKVIMSGTLNLRRCPHCSIASPLLNFAQEYDLRSSNGVRAYWRVYICTTCAGIVAATGVGNEKPAWKIFPENEGISEAIPERARRSLLQCRETFHAPDGSIMLAAKAVDEMLKAKELTEGSLYKRIKQAVEANMITREMETWAHNIRLDANDQRHADLEAEIPTYEDAERVFKFAKALAEYLFVLPAMVSQGVRDSGGETNKVKAEEDGFESPA